MGNAPVKAGRSLASLADMDLVGRSAELAFDVTDADTALAVGSGSLPVLATPRLLAMLEATTCAAVDEALTPGSTTVGTRVDLEHLAATPIGGRVRCRAVVTGQTSRAVTFAVTAVDGDGRELARGTITRVVVDGERFLARL